MATKFQLVVTAGNLSGVTGHHEVTCYIEETRDDGTVVKGVPEVYGIEVHALTKRHGGDIGQWRNWVAKEMLAKHKRRMVAHKEVMQWSGRRFFIEDEAASGTASGITGGTTGGTAGGTAEENKS
jgi:hypothetical protein